jgi:hypothetical protein
MDLPWCGDWHRCLSEVKPLGILQRRSFQVLWSQSIRFMQRKHCRNNDWLVILRDIQYIDTYYHQYILGLLHVSLTPALFFYNQPPRLGKRLVKCVPRVVASNICEEVLEYRVIYEATLNYISVSKYKHFKTSHSHNRGCLLSKNKNGMHRL